MKEPGWQGEGWGTGEHMKECIRGGAEGVEAGTDRDGGMSEDKEVKVRSSRRRCVWSVLVLPGDAVHRLRSAAPKYPLWGFKWTFQ